MLLLLTQVVFFRDIHIHVLINSTGEAYLKQNQPFSKTTTMIYRKYSFQKLTQFTQGYNVQDAAAFNTDCFLLTRTCVSSTQESSPIWNKMSLSAP
jgi:hypothetical protein